MANEIKTTVNYSVANGDYTPGQVSKTVQIDQATQGAHDTIQIINTSAAEAITTGDLVTPGVRYMKNLDSTNYVNYGSSTGLEHKLKAGEQHLVRVSTGKTIYGKANSAAVKLWHWTCEE